MTLSYSKKSVLNVWESALNVNEPINDQVLDGCRDIGCRDTLRDDKVQGMAKGLSWPLVMLSLAIGNK